MFAGMLKSVVADPFSPCSVSNTVSSTSASMRDRHTQHALQNEITFTHAADNVDYFMLLH